ncbi:MAG: hypothetical protein ROW52_01280 [Anaerolineaceae bacterium]|jgi:hypothetical protein
MENYKNQNTLMRLIAEAVEHVQKLGDSCCGSLLPDFIRVQNTLTAPSHLKAHLVLMLSATRMAITQIEKKTIALIIGDAPITGQQMSHLVRIRLICAELIGMLTNTLQWIKTAPAA